MAAKTPMILLSAILVVVSAAASYSHVPAVTDLEVGFLNPPARARVQTFWVWMNGNITRSGITADLEAMARVGMGGALIFNVAGLSVPLMLSGPWDMRFQPECGALGKARLDSLMSWADHPDPGIRHFSGTATYAARFELAQVYLRPDREVWLDLGEVSVIAQVRVNQQNLGILWHRPFRIEISRALRSGTNTLEVEVTNLWINRLIGDTTRVLSHHTAYVWKKPPARSLRRSLSDCGNLIPLVYHMG